LYRYVNDRGVTVLDISVPPQYVSRGDEVLHRDGRVKQGVPPAPSSEELMAACIAAEEQQHRDASDKAQLLRYPECADLDHAHAPEIQQIEGLIATAEAGLMTLRSQRDDIQSRAASQERAGREVDQRLLRQLEDIDAERGRLERQIASNRAEIDAVNAAFSARRERLAQLLPE